MATPSRVGSSFNSRAMEGRAVTTAALLGQALAGQNKFADAEPFLLDGYQGMTARAAAVSPRYKTLLAEVADLLAARAAERGDTAGAAKWRAERAAYPLEHAPAPRLVR